ncbi:MAG TPA: glutamine-hydrolyzing GMP synthase, partial [candidate division Zixibacteria bacterium]|nr:glutamine-hydrolyzing GMP synthase [candidate division Zixibacteria bacterium]
MPDSHQMILVLDFGSQFTQLIARRIREASVYCEIVPFNADLSKYDKTRIAGYVLSGGPASVTEPDAPRMNKEFYSQDKPILGICYGMQLVADIFGGRLVKSDMREYGRATFTTTNSTPLFKGVEKKSQVWMSHGDSITSLPKGFHLTGSTDTLETAAIANEDECIYGVQFHPEVYHTSEGRKILHNFLFEICKLKGDWTTEAFIDEAVKKIKQQVVDKQVIVGVSGGIDSTVAALLISKAIGKNLHAVFVNTGLLRKNEFEEVKSILSNFPLSLHAIDASDLFLERLKGVEDPEKKRKIIGNTFIDVFEEQAEKIGNIDFLAQGTLYPDVIESVSFKGGPSVSIKSHHNVGGLKEKMKFKLVEPLRELFKDEVRELG